MPPDEEEIWKAARAAVAALAANGLNCCIFGGAACSIYGMRNRYPNNVDVVVLTDIAQEELKKIIVETDQDFYLVPSRDPDATYEVLWYLLPERKRGVEHACKVDILIPGVIGIPNIPLEEIIFTMPADDIPLMPFIPLLLTKLRGWIDHRIDPRKYVREKTSQDEVDIYELLRLAVDDFDIHLRTEMWISLEFLKESEANIVHYVRECPNTKTYWESLGFKAV